MQPKRPPRLLSKDVQPQAKPILVIACGALTREIHQLKLLNGWDHLHMQAIDASLHFQPQLIPAAVVKKIEAAQEKYDTIYIAYADCGTYGVLDDVIKPYNVERLPGIHCYATFAGQQQYEQHQDEQPGTFYLTDFLVRHFERFVVKALKFDKHPELKEAFFGNYTRIIYLAQTRDEKLEQRAKEISAYLELEYQYEFTDYGELIPHLTNFVNQRAV